MAKDSTSARPPSDEQIRTIDDPAALVELLFEVGEKLPALLEERMVSLGAAVIGPLVDIVADETLLDNDARGQGWAPIHATKLLGALRAQEAIAPMLRLLPLTEPGYIIHDRLIFALQDIGPAVLEPALPFSGAGNSDDCRAAVCAVISKLGVRDDRILAVLLEQLERDPVLGAACLADYGDARALRSLSRAFDQAPIEDDDRIMANQELVEIEATIKDLGGALSPEQQIKFNQVIDARKQSRARLRASTREGRPARLGRNDPCWCGSGRKYKRCHLEGDKQSRTAGRD